MLLSLMAIGAIIKLTQVVKEHQERVANLEDRVFYDNMKYTQFDINAISRMRSRYIKLYID